MDLIKQQVIEIEHLREALVHVHAELSGTMNGLGDEELYCHQGAAGRGV